MSAVKESFDMLTARGAEALAEDTCRFVAQSIADAGGLHMMAVVIARRDPDNEQPYGGVGLINVVAPGEMADRDDAKDLFSDFIRTLVQRTDAAGVLFCSEAWMVNKPLGYKGRPSAAPDRREVAIVNLEHEEIGSCMYLSEIKRDQKDPSKATTGPWFMVPSSAGEGRFLQILGARH